MVTNGRTWLFASAMLAGALTAPASAQYGQPTPQPPQSMPGHGQSAPAASAAAAAAPAAATEVTAAAACVLGHNATAGNALLATPPYSPAEREQATRLLAEMRRCSRHSQLVSSATMIRGAFAEAGVEVGFPTQQAPRTPPLEVTPLIRPTDGDAAFIAQVTPMYQLADCATPRQPDLARAVLATDPGTPAEATAVAALNPTFIACVPAGTQLRIDHRIMRFLFAEALYRWSVVQRDGPASQWAAAPTAAQPNAASH